MLKVNNSMNYMSNLEKAQQLKLRVSFLMGIFQSHQAGNYRQNERTNLRIKLNLACLYGKILRDMSVACLS